MDETLRHTQQTAETFFEKWSKNPDLAFSETLREGSDIFDWILTRNGFSSPQHLQSYLQGKTRILDAGCGNGRVTALLDRYADPGAQIVGIDLVAHDVAAKNLRYSPRVSIHQADLLGDLASLGEFDFIYCQEVLHHTRDPKAGFRNLVARLSPSGEIAIYVYKQKAPLREFADDYVRRLVSELPYDEAMKELEGITLFAKQLSESRIVVRVPAVRVLGIAEGEYDLQRFIYNHFFKNFWNPALSLTDNVAVNYDWYHPQLCSRHNLEEVEDWFQEAHLSIVHSCADAYGITVRGVRP